jgi:hypothetical protein
MVRPGAQTRNPRANCLLPGRRTAFTVCHAMIIAITVVLPAPVASFSASRFSSGLASRLAEARCSRNALPCLTPGATSVSQMAVSMASTWQKNGRTLLKACWRQCWRRRAVSGVTPHCAGFGKERHTDTWPRTSLMIGVGSYCCSLVESPLPSLKTMASCVAALVVFFGRGIGEMNFAPRRVSRIFCVGWPRSSNSQCRRGASYGELRIGRVKNGLEPSRSIVTCSPGLQRGRAGGATRRPSAIRRRHRPRAASSSEKQRAYDRGAYCSADGPINGVVRRLMGPGRVRRGGPSRPHRPGARLAACEMCGVPLEPPSHRLSAELDAVWTRVLAVPLGATSAPCGKVPVDRRVHAHNRRVAPSDKEHHRPILLTAPRRVCPEDRPRRHV